MRKLVLLLFLLLFLLACDADALPTAVSPTETIPSATATAVPQPLPSLSASPIPSPSIGEPSIGDRYALEMGNTGYDVQHYTLQFEMDPATEFFYGTTTIDAVATTNNLATLFLDFVGFEIDQLLVNGETAEFYRKDAKLGIELPELLAAETAFTMQIRYQGVADLKAADFAGHQDDFRGIFYPEDTIYVLSEPDGARFWFPNNDHPRDKATFRFAVTVPTPETAVSNGTLVEIVEEVPMQDGRIGHTFVWEHNHPMATYLATVAVGKYERVDDVSPQGIPLRHYTFVDERDEFVRETAVTGEAIDWMSDLFGAYPYDQFGYVTVYAPGVSLETQTMVLLSTNMIDEDTIIHELAHMWFGDYVSLHSWGEMWRNEGFATYLEVLWHFRDDPEGLDLFMAAVAQRVQEYDESNPYPVKNPPPEELFGFNSYIKGALIVHELRQEVGDDAFWQGLKNYFQTYGAGTASDAQFQAIMEEAAGKSLAAFWAKWLDETAVTN